MLGRARAVSLLSQCCRYRPMAASAEWRLTYGTELHWCASMLAPRWPFRLLWPLSMSMIVSLSSGWERIKARDCGPRTPRRWTFAPVDIDRPPRRALGSTGDHCGAARWRMLQPAV